MQDFSKDKPRLLFDPEWYLAQNPDVAASGIDPLEHFLDTGGAEGRDPHPFFFSRWYLKQYPEVEQNWRNASEDYINFGQAAGRYPNPLFAILKTDHLLTRYRNSSAASFQTFPHLIDAPTFVRAVVGYAAITKEWGALFDSFMRGSVSETLDLISVILDHDRHHCNQILSPARTLLYALKAECHLANGNSGDAVSAAKQSVLLMPEHPGTVTILKKSIAATPRMPVPPSGFVVLLFTCEKHQDRAMPLYRTLVDMGLSVKAVVGAGARIRADYDLLQVSAGDFYEDFSAKVRDGIAWAYENYETGTGVLKIDDDAEIRNREQFDQFLLTLKKRDRHYVGFPVGWRGLVLRDFHYGKCHDQRINHTPYGKRSGANNYAKGSLYYLSSRAVEKYYEYVHKYPGEILGEVIEDIFTGRVMEECGISVTPVRLGKIGVWAASDAGINAWRKGAA